MVLNCKDKLLDLSQPKIMGIVNLTPDSFYGGSRFSNDVKLLEEVERMMTAGMSIVDVGGMSSRPGAEIIDVDTEIKRVLPAIENIRKTFPELIISIDTIRSEVAVRAIDAGAGIVNDISAWTIDPRLIEVVAEKGVPYILIHMLGRPKDMQVNPQYSDVVKHVLDFFAVKSRFAKDLGIKDIILDPGFGFGKSIDHNYQLLNSLSVFRILDCPILIGLSRKSMIYKLLKTTSEHALNGTTACHMVALMNGAKILRVHDVKEAADAIAIFDKLGKNS